MQKQFTPCPACGALGEVNCTCQFCGTTITLKEGTIATDSRIVKQRTVTPQQYAEKITLYHNVEPVGLLKIVSIGKEYGVVNLNGDLIYPLGSDEINIVNENTIELGYTYETTLKDASTYWDNYKQEWKHEGEKKYKRFIITKYFNLETCIYADKCGFIKDKEDPNKLYRVNVNKNWEPMQTYINIEEKKHSFEYAESIEIKNIDRQLYLLHNGNECSLWLTLNFNSTDIKFYTKYGNYDNIINNKPEAPICVLNGIKKDYKIKENKNNTQIILKTLNNNEVVLNLSHKGAFNNKIIDHYIKDIFKEWRNATKVDKIKDIKKDITLDPNLLKQIEKYIKEIKSNPNINKYLEIYLLEEHPIFFIENNTICTHLPNKPGVSLTTAIDFMAEEQWEVFEDSQIYTIFNDCDEFSNIHIDFSFDVKSLCATIQYLAKIYSCPITNITIKQSKYNIPKELSNGSIALLCVLGIILIFIAVIFFLFGFEHSEMFGVAAVCAITGVYLLIKASNEEYRTL